MSSGKITGLEACIHDPPMLTCLKQWADADLGVILEHTKAADTSSDDSPSHAMVTATIDGKVVSWTNDW